MNGGEISSTFHYWYYLDLLLDRRFIHILNSVVLKMAESLQDRPEFYNSTRGAKKMAFKGFQYGKDKQMDTTIYWKCDDRACKGRVVTSSGEPVIILKETPHNLHGPSVAQIEVKKSLARMKEAAAQGQDAPSRIVNRELQSSLPAEYRPYLPKEATVKRAIQRERRKKIPEPPKSLSDLEIPDEWRTTSKGDNWLLVDITLEGTDRVIIFCTEQNLRHLGRSTIWYGDGTFSVAPQHFYQLYTIHGVVLRQTLPLVYCLLTKKSYNIRVYL